MAVETTDSGRSEVGGVRLPDEFLQPDVELALSLVPDLVTDELVSLRDVTATLESLRSSSQVGPNLRVAVDGGYRQDVRQRLIDSDPAHDGEPLPVWANRLFGAKPFYVVVNELEVFNPALAQRVARLLWPLIESQRSWFGGLSMALLIGREGFTSFGIHRDGGCRWNLQFHLGPAPKSMTVWDDDTLDGASDAELLRVEPLLARGHSFELQEGDLFVLPCQKRHAAHYTDLAVTLVASMRMVTAHDLVEAALQRLLEQQDKGSPSPPIGLGQPGFDAAQLARWDLSGPAFALAVEAERLRQWSNLGMRLRNPDTLPRPAALRGKTLSIVEPFPICQQLLPGGHLRIAARGHTLKIARDEQIVGLIERLNAGEEVAVGAGPSPAVLMMLAFLCGHGAVGENSAGRRQSGSE